MKLKSLAKKAAVAATTALASVSAFAYDHSVELQKAVDDGATNYTIVIVGVITIAAIGFGVGMIVSSMRGK